MALIVANYVLVTMVTRNLQQSHSFLQLLMLIMCVCVLNIHMRKLTSNSLLVVLLYSFKFYSVVQYGVAGLNIICNKNITMQVTNQPIL